MLEDSYRGEARDLLELIVTCMGRQRAIQSIYNRVRGNLADLEEALGPNCDVSSINPGPPTVFFTPLSRHIAPEIYAARRQLLAPYASIAPPPPAQQALAGGGRCCRSQGDRRGARQGPHHP